MNPGEESAPIVPPPQFPVTWDDPADELLSWRWNDALDPHPFTPMSASIVADAFTTGLNFAADFYSSETRYLSRRINTYNYYAATLVTRVPEELESMRQRSQATLDAAMARLGDWWRQDLQPEIERHLAAWDAFEFRGAPLPELLTHLEETVSRLRRVWQIELLVAFPHLVAPTLFEDFYHELFSTASALEPYRLLQGFDNKTLQSDRALWRLGRRARAIPEVHAVLQRQAAQDVLPSLEGISSASPVMLAFMSELHAYLREYGRRDYTQHEFAAASWLEDPTPAIRFLQTYSTLPDREPAMELASLAAEREQCVGAARERLHGYPQPVAERFEFLLKAAQEANVIAEDHNFWIDGRSLYCVRRVLMEWGGRLAGAAVIEQPNDIFYLTLDELREIARTMAGGRHPCDQLGLAAARQAELAYFRTVSPPLTLGTPSSGPARPIAPSGLALGRFLGEPPARETDLRTIRGHAGSPGLIRGPARLIGTLSEAEKLRHGEVLVTRTTATAWTPLFTIAAAIVTDAGGVLSHCAVVAREYRLPAVVGTGVASSRIRDGQMLEVDGSAGVVRLLS